MRWLASCFSYLHGSSGSAPRSQSPIEESIYKTGLVQRETTEINMAKIESVDVSQSILGRVFDFGTLTIRGTGETIEALRNIASPLQFRNAIMVR